MNNNTCIITNDEGYELIRHGTMEFPIAIYNDDIYIHPVNYHWHNEFESGIVRQGTAIISSGTDKILLNEGEGFFINSNVFHGIMAHNNTSCILDSIVFHPRLIGGQPDTVFWQKYISPIMSDSSLSILKFTKNDNLNTPLSYIDQIYGLCETTAYGYEFEVRSFLSSIIYEINKNWNFGTNKPSEHHIRSEERIKLMLQYIHNNFNEEISTKEIAGSAMISNTECLRCFHNIIGSTPIQYLKEYRIGQAAELLQSTNMKISYIAEKCGFSDMSYFAKTFRQAKGLSPKDFRNLNTLKT